MLDQPERAWLPFCMRIDQPPFTDVRVRQAFRLIVDREQMIEQAISGYGTSATTCTRRSTRTTPRRARSATQDIDKAKSLLKAAGQDGLTSTCTPPTAPAGMVEAAQVFAQQAQGRRRHVNVKILDSRHLLRRPVPQVAVLDGLLGHAQLPLPGGRRAACRPRRTTSTHWPGPTRSSSSLYKQAKAAPTRTSAARSSRRCSRSSTTRAATSSGASTTCSTPTARKVTGLRARQGHAELNGSARFRDDLVRLGGPLALARAARTGP